jgi:ribonucleoside-triphosphate reductase
MVTPTARAQAAALRTYHRPLHPDDPHSSLETWEQVIDRVINHQRWLWERALKQIGKTLEPAHETELEELRHLLLKRKTMLAGRTMWLGGTELSRTRESSGFNCSFTNVATIWDVVDVLWLLLQGCGVGFRPVVGMLSGFRKPLKKIDVVRSTRTDKGNPQNQEIWEPTTKTWTIKVGDSAEAWAKASGKLVAGKYPADHLVLDFTEVRPVGYRLKGYGWISSGDRQISRAFTKIAEILSNRADQLLTAMDILDICNHLGTMLSSRRSAQIALLDYEHPECETFAMAKKDYWKNGNEHRRQSNNSIVFHVRPSLELLERMLYRMYEGGGSEPGIINAEAAKQRAPWFQGVNPCGEILLGNKSFCCLVEINLMAFQGDKPGLMRALYIMGRANYRATLVNLRDEILQESWHTGNAFLHLCGVSLTGIVGRPDLGPYDFKRMSAIARHAAYQMAQELDQPSPKNVTCVKPSGTAAKVLSSEQWGEVPEGIHKPLGRYIFNWVTFSKHDPLVPVLQAAGYRWMEKPNEAESVLICFPVRYDNVPFQRKVVKQKRLDPQTQKMVEVDIEVEVNTDSAVQQLERYRLIMTNWCDQNVSITISYDRDEIPEITRWLYEHWDEYVAVSFILRNDPTKTAADLGHPYLPQEVVCEQDWVAYVSTLKDVDWNKIVFHDEVTEDPACATGACPVR